MGIRQLNNEYRNFGITFTTVSEKATRLDTVRTELSGISPDMQKPTFFGDQIAAMQNDNTAATVTKRKTLGEEFAQAEKDLEETISILNKTKIERIKLK